MSEDLDLNVSEVRRRARQNGAGSNGHDERWKRRESGTRFRAGASRVIDVGAPYPDMRDAPAKAAPVNLLRLSEVLLRRWKWLLIGTASAGLLAFLAGLMITSFTARVSLIRRENPNAFTAGNGENAAPQAYISRELSAQTLFGLMRSPEVFRRVSEKARPPVRPDELARGVRIIPERNPDFVTVAVSGKEPKETLSGWANVYADEVVNFTRELQADEAGSISDFLKTKVAGIDRELARVNAELVRFSDEAHTLDVDKEVAEYTAQIVGVDAKADGAKLDLETLDVRIQNLKTALAKQAPTDDRLQAAEEELARLRMRYTDLHYEVQRQKAIVENLRKQKNAKPSDALESRMPGGSLANAIQLQILDLESLKEVRQRELEKYAQWKARMQEKAKGLSKTAVAYNQFRARQKQLEDLRTALVSKQQEAQLLRENALGYFKVFAYCTPNDVSGKKRLFTVGLLAIVGALLGFLASGVLALIAEAMDTRIRSAADLERVTRLPVLATLGDLRAMTPEQQITWAFRTLTLLQGKLNTASDQTLVCGFISSRHGEGRSTWVNLLVSAASQRGMRVLTVATRPSKAADDALAQFPKDTALLPMGPATTLTKNVLAYPAQVTEQFSDPQAQPIVHIPLPGWVWNLERRQQWRTALDSWQEIPNLVLLIELPPACQPESVLLAEHLPQVIWLTGSGLADAEESRAQLETLRHARCNLVGAVLNREASSLLKRHLGRWARGAAMALACSAIPFLQAAQPGVQAPNPNASEPNSSFSITAPNKRAPWQERLTLGPGDVLDISLFGHPETARTNIVVGPDGKIDYLQLQGLPATGLTIDEFRAKLDGGLGPYFVGGVRSVVIPERFNSKKYFVLGRVVTEGAFVLERPLTIVEAVARAKGFQTATAEQGTAELADLGRSFLVRQGKRVAVDFERLFHEGDLSQNIPIEPNDYLYFAPAGPQEIFVLGEVLTPGRVSATSDASIITAISGRGGFTMRAYKKRVLVIRGSLQRPQAFAVDTPAILAGRTPDFRLEPKDIVYVSARPWIRVEDLLDLAAQAFIESAVTVWAGENVPPAFGSPVVPSL